MSDRTTCGFHASGFRCGQPMDKTVGRATYCIRHFRFMRMRAEAKHRGKAVPTVEQLSLMVPPDMRCPHCLEEMIWTAAEGLPRDRVMCLQHYNDGAFGLICLRCNSKHGQVADVLGDHDFLDESIRFCRRCKQFKPAEAFYPGKAGCRECLRARNRITTRLWRDRKMAGGPR